MRPEYEHDESPLPHRSSDGETVPLTVGPQVLDLDSEFRAFSDPNSELVQLIALATPLVVAFYWGFAIRRIRRWRLAENSIKRGDA